MEVEHPQLVTDLHERLDADELIAIDLGEARKRLKLGARSPTPSIANTVSLVATIAASSFGFLSIL